jgi:hypothetical protein
VTVALNLGLLYPGLYFLGTSDVPVLGGEWDGHPDGQSPSGGKMIKNLDILHTKIYKLLIPIEGNSVPVVFLE